MSLFKVQNNLEKKKNSDLQNLRTILLLLVSIIYLQLSRYGLHVTS